MNVYCRAVMCMHLFKLLWVKLIFVTYLQEFTRTLEENELISKKRHLIEGRYNGVRSDADYFLHILANLSLFLASFVHC